MILKALTLQNFKGIREPVRIEFAPLTLLFGPNSSGKSTVIKALQFANEIFHRPDASLFRSGSSRGIELGSFQDVVNGHDLGKMIGLKFDLAFQSPRRADYDPEELLDYASDKMRSLFREMPSEGIAQKIISASIDIRIRYDDSIMAAYVSEFHVSLNEVRFGTIEYSASDESARISFLNYSHPLLIEVDPEYSSLGSEQGCTAYAAWLKSGDLTADMDRDQLDGDWSNTALESFVTDNNEAPWENKAYPIRIGGQKAAIPNLWSPMYMAIDKKNAFGWTGDSDPDSNLEPKKYCIAAAIISEGFLAAAASLHNFLENSVFLGPLRQVPTRYHRSIAKTNWSAGEAAWDIIMAANHEFVSEVNAWLSDADKLNSGYGVDVVRYREIPLDHPLMRAVLQEEDIELTVREPLLKQIPVQSRVILRDRIANIELSLQDVGVGLSQLLPVVVAGLHESRGYYCSEQLVAIEQPELHLHPALQVRLADLFIATAKARKKLFLLETHSEHLMLRCLRRIREKSRGIQVEGIPAVAPEDIAVNFVEATDTGPRIRRIEIDADGDFIDEWPGGFFEESYREKFAGR